MVVVVVRFLETTHTQAMGSWDGIVYKFWCVTVLRSSGSRSSWPFALFFLLFRPHDHENDDTVSLSTHRDERKMTTLVILGLLF